MFNVQRGKKKSRRCHMFTGQPVSLCSWSASCCSLYGRLASPPSLWPWSGTHPVHQTKHNIASSEQTTPEVWQKGTLLLVPTHTSPPNVHAVALRHNYLPGCLDGEGRFYQDYYSQHFTQVHAEDRLGEKKSPQSSDSERHPGVSEDILGWRRNDEPPALWNYCAGEID